MTDTPDRRISRWGRGLAPVTELQWQVRRSDIMEIMRALQSPTTPELTEELGVSVRRMATVFEDVSDQSTRSWFVTSALMAHPSPRLARRISSGLKRLYRELCDDSIQGINEALGNLEESYVPRLFETYMEATRPINPVAASAPSGWAYLLVSNSEPTMMLVGQTEGTLEDVIARTSRANPDMAAFGVAAAWRVTDPDLAHRMITREIGHRHVANDYHLFDEPREFVGIRRELDGILAERKIVVGNPFWEPQARVPILEMNLYATDIRNRKFKVDIGGVFETFRI